nr:CDP-glycerol glycerophosphotransferase family protein [Comamonas testosteroni]
MNFLFKNITNILLLPLLDWFGDAKEKKIAFVIKRTVPFSGNVRAMADALLEHGGYQLVIYKDGPLGEAGEYWKSQGALVYSRFSVAALRDVMSAGTVVLGHSGRDAMLSRRKRGRRVINLWHGVAIKRIEHLMRPGAWTFKSAKRRYLMRRNSGLYDGMIASSSVDRLTNALAFGVDFDKIHVTGLPRFDYLSPDFCFPDDLQSDISRLDAMLAGRRLVLYAPTFREEEPSALTWLEPAVVQRLKAFLHARNLVLGIRPHPYDQKALNSICDGQWIIDLRPDKFLEPAIPLRAASALVVDYSSIWIDYLLLHRPIVGFMPDMHEYITQERGFIYDLPTVFPGDIFGEWNAVLSALAGLADSGFAIPEKDEKNYWQAENMFLPPESLRFKSTAACMELFFGSGQLPSLPKKKLTN